MATVTIAGAFIDSSALTPKTGLTDVTCTVTRNNVVVVNAQPATELNLPGVYGYDVTYDLVTDADTVWQYSFTTGSSSVTAKTVYNAFAIGKLGLERIDATVSSRLADADAVGEVQAAMTAQGYTTARAGYMDTLNGLVTNIWAHGTRTLSSFGTLVSDVWGAATRTITGGTVSSIPSVQSDVQSGLTAQGYTSTRAGYLDALNGIVAAIWSHSTRTVTSFGTLVADVWANATRTITGGTVGSIPSVQSDVQAGLTAQGYTSTRAGYLDVLNGIVAAIWAHTTRGLTTFGTLVADVWAHTTRTLTSAGSGGATAQEVWEYATRTLTSGGSGATAQEVWEYATREITGGTVDSIPSVAADVQTGLTAQGYTSTRAGYLDTLNGLVANIWNHGTRSLTTFGTLVSSIWSNATRTITGGTVTTIPSVTADVQTALTNQGYTSTRAGYLDTLNGLVSNIWSHGTRTLTSFGSLVTDIWEHATRTLTSFGSLPASVWGYVTRTLTSGGGGGGGATATEIWTYPARTLTAPHTVAVVPVSNGGKITLRQGDTYNSAENRAITVTIGVTYDMTDATVRFKGAGLDVAGTITPSGAEWALSVELSSLQTAALKTGLHNYEFELTLANGHVVTPVTGLLSVVKQIGG